MLASLTLPIILKAWAEGVCVCVCVCVCVGGGGGGGGVGQVGLHNPNLSIRRPT